jgi:hypothetical protein
MTHILKISLIVIASAIAGACFTSQYNNDTCQAGLQPQPSAMLLHKKIARLEQENRKLTDQLNKTLSAPAHPIGKPMHHQLAMDTSQPSAVDPISDEQTLRKSEKFSTWLASAHKEQANFDLNKEMQLRFDAEAVDPYWSAIEEHEYLSLFSQNPELSGVALRETQCRTQQCVLTISITDLNQANLLVEKMSAVLGQKNRYPLIISAPDEQLGITRLYIGKDANSFDFN